MTNNNAGAGAVDTVQARDWLVELREALEANDGHRFAELLSEIAKAAPELAEQACKIAGGFGGEGSEEWARTFFPLAKPKLFRPERFKPKPDDVADKVIQEGPPNTEVALNVSEKADFAEKLDDAIREAAEPKPVRRPVINRVKELAERANARLKAKPKAEPQEERKAEEEESKAAEEPEVWQLRELNGPLVFTTKAAPMDNARAFAKDRLWLWAGDKGMLGTRYWRGEWWQWNGSYYGRYRSERDRDRSRLDH